LSGLDEKIIALYARVMSGRDIQAHLQEMYGVEVLPTLISIETVFPKTQMQLCIVHMVRNSVAFVPWQHPSISKSWRSHWANIIPFLESYSTVSN